MSIRLIKMDTSHWFWFSILCICTFFFTFPLWVMSHFYKNLIIQESKQLEVLIEENQVLSSATFKFENTLKDVEHLLQDNLNSVYLNVKTKIGWMSLLLYSTIYIGPVLIVAHYWAKRIFYTAKISRDLKKLKRMKEDNERLQAECERLESFVLENEMHFPCVSAKSEEGDVELFTQVSESLMKSQEELVHMFRERDSLLEQLEIAKKQRDDAKDEYNRIRRYFDEYAPTFKSYSLP